MSLINDALKRASQSDKNRSAPARLPRPMQPVAAPRQDGKLMPWIIAAMAFAAVALALAAVLALTHRSDVQHATVAVPAQPVKQQVAEAPPPAPKPAPIVQQPAPSPTPSAPIAVVAAPIPAPAPPIAPAEVFPTNLTVKAIFYSKINPRALVNGRTVETGDKIGDVLVTGIMSDRVFVDWKGQSKVLMMGGQ